MTQTGNRLIELDPAELRARLAQNAAVLVDVREPAEYAAEHIAGAISMPLSSFDPRALPGPPETLVLSCQGGKRSAMAVAQCAAAGIAATTHLRGGLGAWKAAGLPTTR